MVTHNAALMTPMSTSGHTLIVANVTCIATVAPSSSSKGDR